jgi:hypothetical protein
MCWLNGPKCLCGSGSVNVTSEVLKAYHGTTFQACHEVHELVVKYNGIGILSYTPIWRAPLQLSNTYFILGNDLLSEKHQDASKLVCGYKDMWKLLYQLKKYPDHASDLSFVYNTLYEDGSSGSS